MPVVGTVVAVWRYPVKSFGGERLAAPVPVSPAGVEGDRGYAVVDDETGAALSAKRVARLFEASAAYLGTGRVRMAGPGFDLDTANDEAERVDAALSQWLGRPVHLAAHAPPRRFFDSRSSIHLLTLASLGGWDARRFRPNLVVDTDGQDRFAEDGWVGGEIDVGGIRAHVRKRTSRCVMTTLAQADLPQDDDVLRTLEAARGGDLGVYLDPQGEGAIAAGAAVAVPAAIIG